MSFTEIADRVWVTRRELFDVNVTVVGGAEGLLVVDTFASAAGAREIMEEVRRLSPRPVAYAVNTHVHFDHTFGNGTFAAVGAELVCHEAAAEALPAHGAQVLKAAADDARADPRYAPIAETEVVVPERTFSSALVLDVGDRTVELVHPGAGHTAGDIVLRLPDADVVLAGDLVEESAQRDAEPGYGEDCFPLEWPRTLDLVLDLVGPATVVVPGHGAPVDREFVENQRADIGIVAETIRDLAGRGVPLDQALAQGQWPYPAEHLAEAVHRGYDQLPRSQKRLPLL